LQESTDVLYGGYSNGKINEWDNASALSGTVSTAPSRTFTPSDPNHAPELFFSLAMDQSKNILYALDNYWGVYSFTNPSSGASTPANILTFGAYYGFMAAVANNLLFVAGTYMNNIVAWTNASTASGAPNKTLVGGKYDSIYYVP
jgi:hypothetical protein